MLITRFDPWKSSYCTCPLKYSLNPYTGCSHGCLYCYITSYIPNAFNLRVKKNVVKRVEKELREKKDKISYISLSNSSDPYPPEEKKYEITRAILNVLNFYGIKRQIVTKSDLVKRDVDLLQKTSVSMSITTMKDSKRIEPNAPDPEKRIEALKELSESGIKCSLRLDPIMPHINDSYESMHEVIFRAAPYIKHVTASTLKPRYDSLKRMKKAFPGIDWDGLYIEKVGRAFYLDKERRMEILLKVRDICKDYGLTFSCCREGIPINDKNVACDGSHLI